MTREQVLEKKLDELAERTLSGESTSAAELCRDTPELLAELERCLRAIHAFDRIRLPRAPAGPSGATESFAIPGHEVKELGRYRLEMLLGAGGMGEVWRAFDTHLERAIAIKLLSSNLVGDASARARFLREARAAAKIDHDNVVSIYDAQEIDGNLVLAMPLLKGETLESRVRRSGPLAAQELVQLGVDLLAGLTAAHRAGLIHRDVKPSNVWLESPSNRAMLLDFGLARPETGDGLTHAGGIFGTPGYMSPEQSRGEPLDGRTDLFSAGAVMYLAATGRPPFAGPGLNTLAVLERTKTHDPTPVCLIRPELPVEISDFIRDLMHKDVNGRPATAEAAADRLRRIGGLPASGISRPIQAAETPTGSLVGDDTERMTAEAGPKPLRRKTKFVAMAAAIGLVLMLALFTMARGPALWRKLNKPTSNPEPMHVNSSGTVQSTDWQGTLDVLVARGPDQGRQYLMLNTPGVLPLQPKKDHVQVHAKLNKPAYLYVVWIDTEGKAGWVHPWDEKNQRRPADEKPLDEFYWPSPTRAAELTGGPAGTETLLMFAREEKLPADTNLLAYFADLPKQKSKFRTEAAWFENGQLVVHDRVRSSIGFDLDRGRPDAKKTVDIDDPVIRLQVLLRSDEIRKLFPYTRGVCFSNAGDR